MLKIKDIKSWEDYTIDTEGNVFSKRKNKYLKQTINKYGYCKVTLQKDKYRKTYSVHRLVAQTFIKNINNYPCVNHIDSNKTNNNIYNLEWVTHKQNMEHAVTHHRFDNMAKINREKMKNNKVYLLSNGYKKANKKRSKKVAQYDKNNNFIRYYKSISEASRQTGITIAGISYSANNVRKTGGGYIWHFA